MRFPFVVPFEGREFSSLWDWTSGLETRENGALGVPRADSWFRDLCGSRAGVVAGATTRRKKNTPVDSRPVVIVRSYLVDPASSHMLVSKIKPCMSKYKQHLYCETANGSLNQL